MVRNVDFSLSPARALNPILTSLHLRHQNMASATAHGSPALRSLHEFVKVRSFVHLQLLCICLGACVYTHISRLHVILLKATVAESEHCYLLHSPASLVFPFEFNESNPLSPRLVPPSRCGAHSARPCASGLESTTAPYLIHVPVSSFNPAHSMQLFFP